MSSLSLRLPDSLHRKIRDLAARDHVSINQFLAMAAAEKAAAVLTVDYLAARGKRGSRAAFDRILAGVPSRPPLPGDEIEEGRITRSGRSQRLRTAIARSRPGPTRAARRRG